MSEYRTRYCGCTAPRGIGFPRPDECDVHGERFHTDAELEPKERPPRRSKPKEPARDWSLATTKKEEEGCCRICKRSDIVLESAHILGREHDEPKIGAGGQPLQELLVLPDRIIPACGPFPNGCHGDIDLKRINYLPHLTLDEQIQAVRDAGGIAPAYMRLMPVEHRKERERTAYSEASHAA